MQGGALWADFTGGGILAISSCLFEENVAESGGAIFALHSHAKITSSTFAYNSSKSGSSIYFTEYGRITIEIVIFASGLQDAALLCAAPVPTLPSCFTAAMSMAMLGATGQAASPIRLASTATCRWIRSSA